MFSSHGEKLQLPSTVIPSTNWPSNKILSLQTSSPAPSSHHGLLASSRPCSQHLLSTLTTTGGPAFAATMPFFAHGVVSVALPPMQLDKQPHLKASVVWSGERLPSIAELLGDIGAKQQTIFRGQSKPQWTPQPMPWLTNDRMKDTDTESPTSPLLPSQTQQAAMSRYMPINGDAAGMDSKGIIGGLGVSSNSASAANSSVKFNVVTSGQQCRDSVLTVKEGGDCVVAGSKRKMNPHQASNASLVSSSSSSPTTSTVHVNEANTMSLSRAGEDPSSLIASQGLPSLYHHQLQHGSSSNGQLRNPSQSRSHIGNSNPQEEEEERQRGKRQGLQHVGSFSTRHHGGWEARGSSSTAAAAATTALYRNHHHHALAPVTAPTISNHLSAVVSSAPVMSNTQASVVLASLSASSPSSLSSMFPSTSLAPLTANIANSSSGTGSLRFISQTPTDPTTSAMYAQRGNGFRLPSTFAFVAPTPTMTSLPPSSSSSSASFSREANVGSRRNSLDNDDNSSICSEQSVSSARSVGSTSSVSSSGSRSSKKPPQIWSPEEHSLFLNGMEQYGNSWAKIASELLPHRTPSQVSSHAQKHFERLARERALTKLGEKGLAYVMQISTPLAGDKIPSSSSGSKSTRPVLFGGATGSGRGKASDSISDLLSEKSTPRADASPIGLGDGGKKWETVSK